MLPFHIDSFFGLSIDATGMLIPTPEGMKLAFHQGKAPQNLLDAKTDTVEIPWKNIKDVQIKRSMFGDSVRLHVVSAHELKDLPIDKDGELVVDIQKKDREFLDAFDKKVDACRAGKAENVDEMIDDIRDFLTDL